jgi:tRNA pseudouridine55 synthase
VSGAWEGLLLVDKPSGPTSHDIVARVRKATGQRRVGHGGTLDPLASGLLPLVLGRATRLVRFLPDSPKVYAGTLRLGLTTDTDDVTGEVTRRHGEALPPSRRVVEAAGRMVGRQLQRPPAVSARKVGGKRLYRLARKGIEVSPAPSEIEIFGFELEPGESSGVYRFVVRVSPGTYVRSLARDLGGALGCGAALESLRRTAVGPLLPDPRLAPERDAAPGVESMREALIPLDRMPLALPTNELPTPEAARRFVHGQRLESGPERPAPGFVAVFSPGGELLGVAEIRDGKLRPTVVIPPSAD